MSDVSVCWIRCGDFRVRDNPALLATSRAAREVVIVFTWCPEEDGGWSHDGTALQLLIANALHSLDQTLRKRYNARISVFAGNSTCAQIERAFDGKRGQLHYNRHYEPCERQKETQVNAWCRKNGVKHFSYNGYLFREPKDCPIFEAVKRGLHIFKAFWDGWHKGGPIRRPVPAPKRIQCIGKEENSLKKWPFPNSRVPQDRRNQSALLTEDCRVLKDWVPLNEDEAWKRFQQFLSNGCKHYYGSITRDGGKSAKESRLSPYFRLGILSMCEVYHTADRSQQTVKKWLRRMAWRDYSYWMLWYWKDLTHVPMRTAYLELGWSQDLNALHRWQTGTTGWPLIDAAMRELRATGYLQQHLRHMVGQYLVEALGISWVEGERWFHFTLADADIAINAMMWQHQGLTGVSQWLTGVECHPIRSSKRIDSDGAYVKKWCPELSKLPLQFVHEPWVASNRILARSEVVFGDTYPHRVPEDIDAARAAFMKRFRNCRENSSVKSVRGNDIISSPVRDVEYIVALTEKSVKSNSNPKKFNRKKGKGRAQTRRHQGPGKISNHRQNNRGRKKRSGALQRLEREVSMV